MSNTLINKTHLTRGYTVAFLSAVILSTTAIFIRYLTQTYHLPALVLACWRDVFVSVSLILSLGLLYPALLRVKRTFLPYLVLYGLVLAIFNSLWTLSVALNGAAVSTVLAYCSAGFTALLGWWLLKERLDWAKLLAVALCMGGCVLVSGALDPAAWRVNLLGIITGVLSGLLYAIYSLMGRSASQRGLNPWSTLVYTFGFAAVFLLAFNLLGRGVLPGAITPPGGLPVAGKGLGRLGDSVPAGGGTDSGRLRVVQCQPDLPAFECGQPDRHPGARHHRRHRVPAAGRTAQLGPGGRQPADPFRGGLPANL